MSSFEVQQQQQQQGNGKGYDTVVIRDEASCVVQQESSGDSGSTLKAHDYIGLSEVSSMAAASASEKSLPDLNIGETELRLGPPKSLGSKQQQQHQQQLDESKNKQQEFWQSQMSRNNHQDDQYTKNNNNSSTNTVSGAKRGFTEALGSGGFVDGRVAPGGGGATTGPNGKSPLMYPWTTAKQLPAAWRMGLEQSKGSFGPFPSPARPMHTTAAPKDDCNANGNGWDSASSSPVSKVSNGSKEDASDDVAPSSSPPVVGWPPVQSFRKNTLASHPPPAAPPSGKSSSNTENAAKTSSAPTSGTNPAPAAPQGVNNPLFVKVYMDGVPIGRKVDLKSHNSYEKLSSVLEEMFHRFITGQNGAEVSSSSRDAAMTNETKKLNFLHGSEFVLTYEDRDGDLMLVGDVPWGMFTGTVKRLRIMKGSEAIGLAPRASGDNKVA